MCCVPVRMIHYITTATQYSKLGYELVLGTSWSGYELVVGTSWSRYELVLGTSWSGYKLVLGTSWHGTTWLGYELTGNRTNMPSNL